MVPAHLACRNLASVHPTCILAAEITQGVSHLGIPATVAVLLASQQLPGRAEGSREDWAPGGLSDTLRLRLGVAVSVLWEPRQAQPGKHLGDPEGWCFGAWSQGGADLVLLQRVCFVSQRAFGLLLIYQRGRGWVRAANNKQLWFKAETPVKSC